MLQTLRFCHVNIFIQNFIQFFGVYFYRYMLYMTGLPLFDNKHEHNTVNMLCSLNKLLYYNSYRPPHNGHVSTRSTFFCPKGGHCGEV